MAYAVQYTISVLTGAYAQKYSVVVYDAARLAGLLRAAGAKHADLADDAGTRDYDAYECFQALMGVIKKYSKKQFCTAIEWEHDGVTEAGTSFCDEDDAGPFEVRAYGFKGTCVRGEERTQFTEMAGRRGTYRAVCGKVIELFKTDLENLLNLCEETLAKDGRLLVRTVPNDTPAPQPLFRL